MDFDEAIQEAADIDDITDLFHAAVDASIDDMGGGQDLIIPQGFSFDMPEQFKAAVASPLQVPTVPMTGHLPIAATVAIGHCAEGPAIVPSVPDEGTNKATKERELLVLGDEQLGFKEQTARSITPSPTFSACYSALTGAGYEYACPKLTQETRERRQKVSARLRSWRSRNYKGNFVKRNSRLFMKVTYNENGQIVTRFPNRQRVANNRSREGGMFTNKRTNLPSTKSQKERRAVPVPPEPVNRKRSFDSAFDDALEAAAAAGIISYDESLGVGLCEEVVTEPPTKVAKTHLSVPSIPFISIDRKSVV